MKEFLTPTKVLIAALVFSVGVLAFVYSAQIFWDIQSCALCQYQRYCHMVAIAVCALALLIRQPSLETKSIFFVGATYLGTAGLAFYQVLVEKKVVELPSVCNIGAINYDNFSEFKKAMLGHKHVSCDEVQWSLFGISMAGYSCITALLAALACFLAGSILLGEQRVRHEY
jgi:disulfide bond formation protein DsbB